MGFFKVVLVDQGVTCATCKQELLVSEEDAIWSWARRHAHHFPTHEVAVHINKRWEWTGA